MRILGFSKRWQKLSNPEFTTFRFARKDRDWEIGEQVQIVYKPRSKNREVLGVATVVGKNTRFIPPTASQKIIVNPPLVTEAEAIADGFESLATMLEWLHRTYGMWRAVLMNKLTLRKIGDW